jgi:hypothetical protein
MLSQALPWAFISSPFGANDAGQFHPFEIKPLRLQM